MLGALLFLSLVTYFSEGITNKPVQDEIWYIWIDTHAKVDGVDMRIVSKEPFSITCCVKSGKYSRLQKDARKWIKKNYDPGFSESPLKNIQDESLALLVIEKAIKDSKEDNSILVVDFTRECK